MMGSLLPDLAYTGVYAITTDAFSRKQSPACFANFYNITIRIANVAARLAVLVLWLCDKLGSSTSPQFIARLNICNADIHKAAD